MNIHSTHSWVIEVNTDMWGTITEEVVRESKDGWWIVGLHSRPASALDLPYIPKKVNGDPEDYEPVFALEAGLVRLREIQEWWPTEVYRLRNLFDGTVIMGDAV